MPMPGDRSAAGRSRRWQPARPDDPPDRRSAGAVDLRPVIEGRRADPGHRSRSSAPPAISPSSTASAIAGWRRRGRSYVLGLGGVLSRGTGSRGASPAGSSPPPARSRCAAACTATCPGPPWTPRCRSRGPAPAGPACSPERRRRSLDAGALEPGPDAGQPAVSWRADQPARRWCRIVLVGTTDPAGECQAAAVRRPSRCDAASRASTQSATPCGRRRLG